MKSLLAVVRSPCATGDLTADIRRVLGYNGAAPKRLPHFAKENSHVRRVTNHEPPAALGHLQIRWLRFPSHRGAHSVFRHALGRFRRARRKWRKFPATSLRHLLRFESQPHP